MALGNLESFFQSDYLVDIRATSHTRLGARDHYTSSSCVGGKGGARPSSATHYA